MRWFLIESPKLGVGSLSWLVAELSSQGLDAELLQVDWSTLSTPDAGVRKLRQQVERVNVGDFGLVGHSAGALLAIAMADCLSTKPKRLVLIDPQMLPRTGAAASLAGDFQPDRLTALAGPDGRLPKWSTWGTASSWRMILNDANKRDEIEARLPLLALSLVLAPLAVVEPKDLSLVVIVTSPARLHLVADASQRGWEVHDWRTQGHLAPVAEARTFARLLGPILS